MSELKYSNKTLEYKLVVVLEDVLGKIRYLNIPWAPLDQTNVEIPSAFFNYDENGKSTPCFNKADRDLALIDRQIETFLSHFFDIKLNEIWTIPIKEIKGMYYEFVYTHPFIFGENATDSSLHNKLIDGTPMTLETVQTVVM